MLMGHWKFSNWFSAELFCLYWKHLWSKVRLATPHFLAAVGKGMSSPLHHIVYFRSFRRGKKWQADYLTEFCIVSKGKCYIVVPSTGKCLSPERSGIIGKSRDNNDNGALWTWFFFFFFLLLTGSLLDSSTAHVPVLSIRLYADIEGFVNVLSETSL